MDKNWATTPVCMHKWNEPCILVLLILTSSIAFLCSRFLLDEDIDSGNAVKTAILLCTYYLPTKAALEWRTEWWSKWLWQFHTPSIICAIPITTNIVKVVWNNCSLALQINLATLKILFLRWLKIAKKRSHPFSKLIWDIFRWFSIAYIV